MDSLIYTTMSGAERALHAQQVHANNLANVETGGFRADLEQASSQLVPGYGYDARYLSQLQASTVSARSGPVRETGRDLDAAIAGQGYFTVQWSSDGGQAGEAYTRAGHFDVDADGALTVNGRPVIGEGGPIVLPPYERLEIAQDGSVLVQAPGETDMQPVDRLKLVNPDPAQVAKNAAGLVVARDGAALPEDDTVAVHGGHLEGSNVSAIEEMVAVMDISRDFEIQMKLLRAADSMADTGNTRLLRE
ncbi:flagellar basal body rod protein FlgF [Ramlibacter sp. H39-3-26]|uniref:flagellar basal body rod protein FlgF n=1 Tax=Curvibacter soli TaxID=3031331 RepID=UPI0023DCC61D|nr:flagellar basal body rod protein FlgF [Ramlibacter sp. H39-3-26]MDF1484199.1 flagellar basal body rod protein FlgF [Ramlibacter sp. H39-3-26]